MARSAGRAFFPCVANVAYFGFSFARSFEAGREHQASVDGVSVGSGVGGGGSNG